MVHTRTFFRCLLNVTMASPGGELITNAIDIKTIESTQYINLEHTSLVQVVRGPSTVKAEVTMCCQKLFARLQKLYSLGGHKVPTMISGLLFPSPHSEEGERLKAEGALACKEGNMRKKR